MVEDGRRGSSWVRKFFKTPWSLKSEGVIFAWNVRSFSLLIVFLVSALLCTKERYGVEMFFCVFNCLVDFGHD